MKRVKIFEHIIQKFLYYVRRVYNTCLFPLSTTETRNKPIEQDEKNVHQFLDYMVTYPNAVVIFHTSDIIVRANTDASYITEPE